MRRSLFILGLICVLATPTSVHAWGYDAHKFVVARAIQLLPDGLRPLFEANRTIVVEHAIDFRRLIDADRRDGIALAMIVGGVVLVGLGKAEAGRSCKNHPQSGQCFR